MRTRSAFRIMATVVLALIVLFPFLYALLASFFAASDFATSPARFIPEVWKVSNYSRIAANRYFPTYVVNSVLTGLMSTSIRMVVAFLASYAFSHFRFKGDSACLAFIILTLFIPSDLLLSGNYMTIQKLGLLDTYAGIISTSLLPASQILMLRQYFRSIPGSIRDSAMMDGCSDERYILSILLPISRALVSTFLLQGFVGMFNSYLWPLLVTNSPSMRTVQIGITMLGYAESLDYGPVFAAIVVVTVPFVVVTLLSLAMTLAASGAPEDDGRITITWWHSNSGVIGEAADALVEKFNRTIGEENGIYVEAIYQGSANDTLTKVRTVAQAGDPSMLPDLVQLDSTGVVDMAGNESLYYVEDLAADQGEDLSFILDHALESMKYRGKVIGLPFNASTLLFYYNRTLFDQLGLEAPRTLDDLIKAAPALIARDDKGNVTRYAIASVPTTYELCSFIGMQHGLSYITDMSNGHDGTPTRTLFEEDGTLHDFLVKWKELYGTGGLNNLTSGVSAEFAAGRTASMLASTSNLTSVGASTSPVERSSPSIRMHKRRRPYGPS